MSFSTDEDISNFLEPLDLPRISCVNILPTSLITANRFLMNQFKEIILLYDEILIYSRLFFKNWEAYINKRLNCMIEICVLLFILRMSFWNVKNNTFVFTINKIKIQFTNLPKRDGTPNRSLKRSESFTNQPLTLTSVNMTPRLSSTISESRCQCGQDRPKTGIYPFHKKWWPVTHTWWCMCQKRLFLFTI